MHYFIMAGAGAGAFLAGRVYQWARDARRAMGTSRSAGRKSS